MILVGDCRERLRGLPERSVQTCVTSPPYFGLRDYGHTGQIGLEPTPDEFVAALVAVFREVRRVLRDDGTVWLNLGDSYAATSTYNGTRTMHAEAGWKEAGRRPNAPTPAGCKPKDLIGIPWMVAFALRADGWYLRSDIIWNKPNPMPESVTDRPTKAHEYLFLLSKGPRYFYDVDAVREDASEVSIAREGRARITPAHSPPGTQPNRRSTSDGDADWLSAGRNKRSVWTVATQPYAGAHFATFPPKLIEPCILAGSPPKCCGECGAPWRRVVEQAEAEPDLSQRSTAHYDTGERYGAGNGGNGGFDKLAAKMRAGEHGTRTVGWESTCTHDDDTGRAVVLDPFAGAGTVGVVCGWHGREHVGVDLNPEYAAMAKARIALEGRPGGKPAHHEAAAVVAEQLGLL